MGAGLRNILLLSSTVSLAVERSDQSTAHAAGGAKHNNIEAAAAVFLTAFACTLMMFYSNKPRSGTMMTSPALNEILPSRSAPAS